MYRRAALTTENRSDWAEDGGGAAHHLRGHERIELELVGVELAHYALHRREIGRVLVAHTIAALCQALDPNY